MTPQEFFDKTVKHLHEQGQPARPVGKKMCKYRMETAGKILKCAVGVHIPAGAYQPEMENMRVVTLLQTFPSLQKFIPDQGLAEYLQLIHDAGSHWSGKGLNADGIDRLRQCAEIYHLSPAIIDQCWPSSSIPYQGPSYVQL
jgi:hypothetical protein